MNIQLPRNVENIINTLQAAGYDAYAVGGCVRDSLLKRRPDDWDITTSALPGQVKEIFKRTIDTGIKHGTVTILLPAEDSAKWETYEVTTYRVDGEYEDSRHPKEVTFTPDLREDLKRRDFTINAMAYNHRTGLVDEFDGIGDLKKKIVKAVGNPCERFTEDALRMMRAVRFAAQLGYEVEPQTKEAIRKLAGDLTKISAERIQVELVKLVTSNHPEHMRLLYETGITEVILPEFNEAMETKQNHPHHRYSVGEHILKSMVYIKPDKVLRLTMLFHDIGKPKVKTIGEDGFDHFYNHSEISAEIAQHVLKRLKFDNDTIDKVFRLVLFHDYKIEPHKKYVRRAVNRIGEDIFPLLFDVKHADAMAQSDYMRSEKIEEIKVIKELYEAIMEAKECVSMKDLKINGKDLLKLGLKGPQIGAALKDMLEEVLWDNNKNNPEYLLQCAEKMLEETNS